MINTGTLDEQGNIYIYNNNVGIQIVHSMNLMYPLPLWFPTYSYALKAAFKFQHFVAAAHSAQDRW